MNPLIRSIAALGLSALCVATAAKAHAEPAPQVLPDYTVFVDPPTGFVFVKLPAGWKFVGKVDGKDVARVPAGVVTALFPGSDDDGQSNRVAARPEK